MITELEMNDRDGNPVGVFLACVHRHSVFGTAEDFTVGIQKEKPGLEVADLLFEFRSKPFQVGCCSGNMNEASWS